MLSIYFYVSLSSDVLPALIYYQKKKVQAIPWNANLDIGTNLSIPISAYIKVC